MEKEKQLKIWVARDQGYIEYDTEHCMWDDIDGIKIEGKLHVFYDTPQLVGYDKGGKFTNVCGEVLYRSGFRFFANARLCGEIPSYMFPEIKEGKYAEFITKL